MRKISIEELKIIQIKILDAVDGFCRKKGIQYWLDCGTLLGAVRHKGYIPWDDDIDIGMMRCDYERFISEFNKSGEKYKVLCLENKAGFIYPYAKVIDTGTILFEPDESGYKIAVNIDIFVYDNAPDDEKKLNQMFVLRDLLLVLNSLRTYNGRPHGHIFRRMFVYFVRMVLKVFPYNFFARKLIRNSKKYIGEKTLRVGNFTSYARVAGSKHIFESFTEETFEGKTYPVPLGYHEWLTAFYGNYMKLPSIDKRRSSHDFVAYIKEKG